MAKVLANQPKPTAKIDTNAVLAEAGDTLVRFGSYLDSLKGRPVDSKEFFRNEPPSILARRRLTKLTAGLGYVIEQTRAHKAKIRDAAHWIGELEEVHGKLEALGVQQRASKVAKMELGPEVASSRESWLGVYNANKLLVRALLAHLGKPELLPLIFDDLAEVHRVAGVSDTRPTDGEGDGTVDTEVPVAPKPP